MWQTLQTVREGETFLQVDERSFRDVHTLSNANAGQKYEPKVEGIGKGPQRNHATEGSYCRPINRMPPNLKPWSVGPGRL